MIADTLLTQAEADALIALDKHRVDDKQWGYTGLEEAIKIPLLSTNGRESFFLDLRRGRVNLAKGTYQNRARDVVVLVRLDFGGAPHRNPDNEEISSPHLHLYREGFGDKWAYQVPEDKFPNLDDLSRTLDDFMRFCNIVQPPIIHRGLFV